MKYSELNQKNKEELEETLKSLKVKLGKLRFDLSGNNLKDTSQIGKAKREIAKAKTALRNK